MSSTLPFTHPIDSGLYDLVATLPGSGLIAIEIGSLTGGSAEVFLKSGKIDKLYCVDPWTNGFDPADPTSTYVASCESIFDERMKFFSGKFEKVRMTSNRAITEFFAGFEGKIDFVYIDGNHQYGAVREDIMNYCKLLKNGGVLAGHDYDPNTVHEHIRGVHKAVNELVSVEETFADTSWAVYDWSNDKIVGNF